MKERIAYIRAFNLRNLQKPTSGRVGNLRRVAEPLQGRRHDITERGGRRDDDVAVGFDVGAPLPGAAGVKVQRRLQRADGLDHAVQGQGLGCREERRGEKKMV